MKLASFEAVMPALKGMAVRFTGAEILARQRGGRRARPKRNRHLPVADGD